jgi:beta-phosphoglucomutase-like phosphatase (HAD superfamily)
MTAPADPRLATVLDTTTHVLLDFDGPVCDVFAGYPADHIAEHLRRLLTDTHDVVLPDDVATTKDPLHVLRRTAGLAPQLALVVGTALRAAEVHAVATAAPVPGSAELLTACRATGRPVAIVSNNSAEAIHAYLRLHGLSALVAHVQGRDRQDPRLMKPNPRPLFDALTALDAKPDDAVLIGDSLTDIRAARAARAAVIAYANRPHKATELADADALTASMQVIAEVLYE